LQRLLFYENKLNLRRNKQDHLRGKKQTLSAGLLVET
jgi:hypothetical protein